MLRRSAILLGLVTGMACRAGTERRADPPSTTAPPPAPVSLTPGDIAGCYSVLEVDGAPPASYSGFWAGPVRLDSALVAAPRERQIADGEARRLRPTVAIPDSLAIDTMLLVSSWRIVAPDAVVLSRSDGYIGQVLRLRAVGDSLVGWGALLSDVIDYNLVAPHRAVVARRVRCGAGISARAAERGVAAAAVARVSDLLPGELDDPSPSLPVPVAHRGRALR